MDLICCYIHLQPNHKGSTQRKGSSKYYIYNPDGEVFLESDRKVYLIKRDNKVCYTKVNKANKEVEVYSLSDRELISTFSYDFYTYYTYNQYDIMG